MPDEYIRRDFALAGTELYKYGEMEIEAVSAEHIQRLPAADVAEVVHAKWMLDRYPYLPARECSRCTIMIPRMKQVPEQFWQYCPNCGAKMDGGRCK